jgi:TP901 family phage tail tape measure protein
MAEDTNASIRVDIDTAAALASIKNLQRQISVFHSTMAKGGAAAAATSLNLQQNLLNSINRTGQFSATIKNVRSTTESFTTALEKNKLSMREYFRYSGAATKTFGRFFRAEFDTINKVARERVKDLQTQYIKMGRDANGAIKAIAVRPLALDMESLATRTQIAAQRQALLNQMLKQGSTNLLNFGKNTQWAGRQLMVGFTIPLVMFGTVASKTFMDIEKQAIRFKRVYGEMFTTTAETTKALEEIKELANEFTKYGVAVSKTMELAADIAATGKMGADLTAQVAEATRLAVLGGVEQAEALKATISLTDAFGVSADELAGKIDFLNAVENQTVTSIEDLTVAIPKAGPVVQQLGGDVQDLTFFLTAMREGGINASEGANALKSGLASMINPTGKAAEMLQGFGINLKGIVDANKGNVKGIVIDFAKALDTLDPLNRAQAIEQLFGKFQFARLSTLFQNVIKEGNQASRVLKLTNATTEELAILSERELKKVEDSPMFKFQKAVEDIKVTLVPLGEAFLKAVTPVLEFGTKILEKFNELDAGAKQFVVGLTAIAGVIGPVFLMGFGLIANGVANVIKGFVFFKTAMNKAATSSTQLGVQTEYMTQQQLEAAAVASSLNQVHQTLRQTFTSEASAVNALTAAYRRSLAAQTAMSGGVIGRTRTPKKYASGILSVPGPKGAGDIVPAMLSPGEAVIPAKQSRKYSGIISSLISDNVPGFKIGRNPFASMLGRSRVAVRMKSDDFSQALKSGGKNARYQSAFATNTGADYRNRSGSENLKQKLARSAMERDLFGLDPKTTSIGARPTYGYVKTSPLQAIFNSLFGMRGKRFNQVTGKSGSSLDIYGDLDLITKSSVAKRSFASVGDSLMNYVRTREAFSKRAIDYNTPMPSWMTEKFSQTPMRGNGARDFSLFEGRFGTPFGSHRQPGTNTYSVNSKPPYIETLTPGGFAFKEIDKVIANNPAIVKQLRAELKAAGLGGVRVSGPGFAARLFKKIGVPGFSNGTRAVTGSTDGKYWLEFLGKRFDLTGPRPKYYADNLPKAIETMRSQGRSDESIIRRIESLYERGRPLTPSDVNNQATMSGKKHEYTVSGGAGAGVGTLTGNVSKSGLFNDEIKFLESEAKKLGISNSQLARFTKIDASHFAAKGDGPKDWKDISKIGPDVGGLNNYLNRVGGHLGKHLMSLTDKELRGRGIDRKELEKLVSGDHPSTKKAASTLRQIARFDEDVWSRNSKNKQVREGAYQATLTRKLIDRRFKHGLYERGLRSYAELINQKVIQDTRRQSKAISGADKKIPSNARVKGGSASDTRMAAVSPGETILTKKTNRELMAGRPVSIPGLGRLATLGSSNFPRLPGFAEGLPEGQYSDGTERVYKTEAGQYRDRATKKRLAAKEAKRLMAQDRQNEKRRAKAAEKRATAEKRSSSIGQSYGMSAKDWDKATKDEQAKLRAQRKQNEAAEKQRRIVETKARIADEQKVADEKKRLADKEEKRAARQAKMQGMGGKVAGGVGAAAMVGVIGGSMMGGQIGEVANQLMMPVMMLSMLAPMLKNPIAIAVASIAGLGIAAYMLDQQFKENVKKAYELETAMGSGTNAIDPLAKAAGKVTSSEIMDRRRENRLNPFEVQMGKTTFGQSYMSSEAGQGLKGTVSKAFLELGRDASISKLTNQMATAVMSGAVSPEQARSVVLALSQELGDTDLGLKVNAQLTQLLGPNGENILTKGLEIKQKLIQESRSEIDVAGGLLGKKGLEDVERVAGLVGSMSLGFGTAIGTGALFDPKAWQAYVDAIRGQDITKRRLNAGETGGFVANITTALQQQKQMVDSLDLEYEQRIANAKIAVNEAKTAKERNKAQEELNDIQSEYQTGRTSLLEENTTTIDTIKREMASIGNPVDVIDAFRAQILNQYKDDALRTGVLGTKGSGGLLDRIDTEGEDKLTSEQSVILNAELNAGNIDVLTFSNLLNGENTEVVVDIITKFGGVESGRIFDIANLIKNPDVKANFLVETGGMTPEELSEYASGLEEMYKLTANSTSGDIIFNAYINDEDLLKDVNEKRAKIQAAIDSNNNDLTLTVVEKLESEGVVGKTVLDTVKENQAYFDSLSEEDQRKYVNSITLANELFLEGDDAIMKEFRAWQIANGGRLVPGLGEDVVIGGKGIQEFLHSTIGDPPTLGDETEVKTLTDGTTSGAKKESPYKNVAKDLKELRQDAVKATGGLKELMKWLGKGKDMRPFKGTMNALVAGGTTEEFQDFVSGLSKKEQGDLFKISDGVAKLTIRGKALQKTFNEVSLGRFVIDQQRAVANSKNQEIAAKRLIDAGMSTSDAYEAVQDSAFAAGVAAMKLGKKGREELATIVDSAKKAEAALIKAMSPDELSSFLKESVDIARDRAQINFEFKVSGDMGVIRSAESDIAALQFQIDDFQAGLQEIAWKEDEINKKYDKRAEALDKVRGINANIAALDKSRLSVSEAIARGDVAAASRAIQDLRAKQAEQALEGQQSALESARDRELKAVRSTGGKSRLQLEASILEKEKEIFKVEEDRLEPARRRVELAESERDTIIASLDLQSLRYDDLANKIKGAETNTIAYADQLKLALGILQDMAKIELPAPDGEGSGDEDKKKFKGTRPGPDKDGTNKGEILEGKKNNWRWDGKKWVKITKLASGGFISGPGTSTSDSIPALLSDGEYVIKASSVNKFGEEVFDDLNRGQLPKFRLGGLVADGASRRKKPGPFQSFEAGFQNIMSKVAENPIIKSIGQFISGDHLGGKLARGAIGILSTPAEIMGAIAKNIVDTKAATASKIKNGDVLGAVGSLIKGISTNIPKAIVEGSANAFAGTLDPSKMQPSMFEKAAKSAIDNNFFNAKSDQEMASLARIIGGTLNLVGDPLTYVGIGAASKAAKALSPAPRGIGVEKVDSVPLRNPNASLIKNLITRKNLHGGGKEGKPFDVNPIGNPENFFGADFFTTPSVGMVKGYKQSSGTIYNASMPMGQAAKLKILDLYPGAKSVEEQFPGLYSKLSNSFDVAESGKYKGDHIKKYLNSPDRHKLLTENKEAASILSEYGINAIRHQAGGPGIASEVFAFINPQNMRAKPIKLPGESEFSRAKALAAGTGLRVRPGFNVLERTEQALIARQTQATIAAAQKVLSQKNAIRPQDFRSMENMKNILSKIDKYSIGPKINRNFPDFQKTLDSLSPQQIATMSRQFDNLKYSNSSFRYDISTGEQYINPFQLMTGNLRTRAKIQNPIIDFLYTRGIIPKPKVIKALEQQIKTGNELSRLGHMEEVGMTPNMGPFPKVVIGRGDEAFVSGGFGTYNLGESNSKILGSLLRSGILGPGSTFMSKSSVLRKDKVFLHENKHIFDKLITSFRSPEKLPDGIKISNLQSNRAIDSVNAIAEASARATDAVVNGKPVSPYNSKSIADPEHLIPALANSVEHAKYLIENYLTPNKNRSYQYSGDWFGSYGDEISRRQKNLDIQIHSKEDLESIIRSEDFLFKNNISGLNGNALTSLLNAIHKYQSPTLSQGFNSIAIENLLKAAKSLKRGGALDWSPITKSAGGLVAKNKIVPKYFNSGGIVENYAKGGDVVPAMLTPGEFVMQKSAVNGLGQGFLSSLNEGQYPTKNLIEPNFQGVATSPTVNANTLATNTSTVLDNSSVYNYNLSVNVSSVSDPNAIAQTVMGQIRRVESQRVRSNKF